MRTSRTASSILVMTAGILTAPAIFPGRAYAGGEEIEFQLLPVSADAPPNQNPQSLEWWISGNEIFMTSGGRDVWLELRIGDWDPDDTGLTVKAYDARIDSSGYTAGLSGTLTGPEARWCPNGDADCIDSLGDGSWCPVAGIPMPCRTAWIDRYNTTFIFHGQAHLGAVDLSTIEYRFGATLLGIPILSPHIGDMYGGTFVLSVSQDAKGTFIVGLYGPPQTGLSDEDYNLLGPIVTIPAKITIVECGGPDCQPNGIPDGCDILFGYSEDCQSNDIPDKCDVAGGTSEDCDRNRVPDECDDDTDGDGVIDGCDLCPNDPNKIIPRVCGCGVPDVDTDSDSVLDCRDGCPEDSNKIAPGVCGCGVLDTDSDLDTVLDCLDQCPGEDDRMDTNDNGTPDCLEWRPVPAVSCWGLIVLTLLLVAGGKLYFGRRPVTQA
ncbi:MAG: hypothetical protein JSU86_02760 [Phycisphaerales bacterium]|nr:MAG: hypothetical protein JSU86_02760 [Phycisphaerales bacterium]